MNSCQVPTANRGGGGGSLWYFHTYIGSVHFFFFGGGGGGVNILNFNTFGGIQKNESFFGYEDFVDTFGGLAQNWTKFRGHFYAF